MYSSPGDPARQIPPHWHYITFGFSDLHGDGRVHDMETGTDGPSGFGFELTMRLKREPDESNPTTRPAALMQALARYVFQSELKAVQHWNCPGVIELLRSKPGARGPWLVTDMRRGETVFKLDPCLQDHVEQGTEQERSNLNGVSSCCSWDEPGDRDECGSSTFDCKEHSLDKNNVSSQRRASHDSSCRYITDAESEQIKSTLKKGLNSSLVSAQSSEDGEDGKHSQRHSQISRKASFDSSASSEAPLELIRTWTLESVHLKFNLEATLLLPLALGGRLKHGRHFTFKSVMNDVAVTLVSPSVMGAITDEEHPFAVHDMWLQFLIQDGFVEEMIGDLEELSYPDELLRPKTKRLKRWPEQRLCITILANES